MEEKDTLSLSDDEENDEYEYESHLVDLQGTLSKWTNYLHGWQDRYIVLKDGTLSYYKSESDTSFGCRGAVSLSKASVSPHQFDECRFDIGVNDSVWYLRASNEESRQNWIDAIELHKQAESGYGSENNLRRHGSMLSLTSATSLSTTSSSSFKRGRGIREKLAEMETFRDILCRQIDTLQSYFDSCASAVAHGTHQDLVEDELDGDEDLDSTNTESDNSPFPKLKGKDLTSILQQHGGHAVDFKGESFTFRATTAGIIATMSHCIELMSQREDSWRKRLEREVEKRKKFEEAYKSVLIENKKPIIVGGPDFEIKQMEQWKQFVKKWWKISRPGCLPLLVPTGVHEGPHCAINDDEFYDAVDTSLDKLEKEVERRRALKKSSEKAPPKISLSTVHPKYAEINEVTNDHLMQLDEKGSDGSDLWELIVEDGEMKVFKREIEKDGIVLDPLKAVHTVRGITGHEICNYFWNLKYRMEWEGTLDSSEVIEWYSEDTFVCHNVIKRVWPASQRDAVFWSHVRHLEKSSDEEPDRWAVINYSIDHPNVPSGKFVRVHMNIALIAQTIIEPPADGNITRDNLKCKISYTANVNPGGWAPASVLRAVYKREYPKFLKRFTNYVIDVTKDKEIMF